MLVDSLAEKIMRVARSLLSAGTRCALLDFQSHPNVGDSAIWIAQRFILRTIGVRVMYAGGQTFVPEQLAARLHGGPILLQGGGNLGDLWPEHQRFRERVIAAFPDRPIIQLPQSIHFQNAGALRRARSVFNAHPNLTILVRDRDSLELAQAEFSVRSVLCPDVVVALGSLKRRTHPSVDVLQLFRTDQESARPLPHPKDGGSARVDWITEPRGLTGVGRVVLKRLTRSRRVFGSAWSCTPYLFDLLARQRLAYGAKLLSSAKVVITDRLHGHILSMLLGIPHVLIGDRYGKIKHFHETWTKDCGLAVWAEGVEEALERAQAWARAIG
jgi:exopolysaccharide biosynthesis predicted pyruvyltransferase EpsI